MTALDDAKRSPRAGTSAEPAEAGSSVGTPALEPREQAALEVGHAFKAASVSLRRLRGRETHRPGQLSYAQFSLLFGLAGECCELSARELAELAFLTPGTVTQMLEGLEAAGLVERSRSADDRRVVLTKLTDRGQAFVDERRAELEPRWQAALERFSERELHSAAQVLTALAEMFDQYE